MKKFNERKFAQAAEQEIKRARAGDWEHAKRVVDWIKKLADDRADIHLLIAAGYIHDIGWRDIFPGQKLTLEMLLTNEEIANNNCVPYAMEFLALQGFHTRAIQEVIDLISAADRHNAEDEFDAIIVDADNLSKLNIDHLREKFPPEEWPRLIENFKQDFPTIISTEEGQRAYPDLLAALETEVKKYS